MVAHARPHLFLLASFKEVLARRPDSVLVLVGDGELRASIEKRIDELGLRSNVILTGQTKTPEDYYCAFDVMALPSVFEGLPMIVVESQASRRPIVVSEVTPDEAIFSNGVSRCSLEEGPSKWAEAMVASAGKTVELDSRSDRFNVARQAQELSDWYLERVSLLKDDVQ